MSSRNPSDSKSRPFPWPCADCYTLTVAPTVMDYTARVKHDGVVYDLRLLSLEVPRCQTCGETYITTAVDEQVRDALRSLLQLLTPAQIRRGVEKLGLKQQELAERLGVAPETPPCLVGLRRLLVSPLMITNDFAEMPPFRNPPTTTQHRRATLV
ncbi:MAG TPA: hypothetical protein VMG10_32975 [Gemmataceae bacterium]|nr:hypothetical protein [Gemmataceae bacterium]